MAFYSLMPWNTEGCIITVTCSSEEPQEIEISDETFLKACGIAPLEV